MQIFLIRHGLTELGEQKRYQGSLDTPLSENGRKQLQPAGFVPELLAVSPLLRARETARVLFPNSRQTVIPGLQEMNFGAFEGRAWWEMEDDPRYRTWVDGGCLTRCPGGEDREEFSLRVCSSFTALLEDAFAAELENMAVVAHGGTQMAILEKWGAPKRAYYQWQTACGHGWLLETDLWPDSLRVSGEVDYTK